MFSKPFGWSHAKAMQKAATTTTAPVANDDNGFPNTKKRGVVVQYSNCCCGRETQLQWKACKVFFISMNVKRCKTKSKANRNWFARESIYDGTFFPFIKRLILLSLPELTTIEPETKAPILIQKVKSDENSFLLPSLNGSWMLVLFQTLCRSDFCLCDWYRPVLSPGDGLWP